jgi:hypothetical protein
MNDQAEILFKQRRAVGLVRLNMRVIVSRDLLEN